MKLSTDNPDTMPITDAVYGQQQGRRPEPKPRRPIPEGEGPDALWRKLPQATLDRLARMGKDTRRYAARRRAS